MVSIQKARRKIILPTPACAELLAVIGPDAQQYINIVSRSRVFEVASFDAKCAEEIALLNRDTFNTHDRNNGPEPYQKIKIDRQIIAICRANGVIEVYTDDLGLAKMAIMCGITPAATHEIAIPTSARQGSLDLQPHEPMPEPDDEPEQPTV